MKLTIAFLQLLPTGSLKGNMEKGIKACFQAKEKGADIAIFQKCGAADMSFHMKRQAYGNVPFLGMALL